MKNPFKKQTPPVPDPPPDKGSFPDFTKKEIFTQGDAINAFFEKYSRAEKLNFDFLKIKIDKIKRIYVTGSGSGYAAAVFAAYNFEALLDIAAFPITQGEFLCANPVLDKSTLVVIIGGCRAAEERALSAKARLIKISPSGGKQTICTDCKTLGAFDTAQFTLSLTAAAALALYFGGKSQVITPLYVRIATGALKALPEKIHRILAGEFTVNRIAEALDADSVFFTGTNVDYAVSLYAASVFSKSAGDYFAAVPSGELKEYRNNGKEPIVFASNADFNAMLGELTDFRLKILPGGAGTVENALVYDGSIPLLNPILSAVEVQMLAYSLFGGEKQEPNGQ